MTDGNPFHVLIIGGVAGGMSCATRLRRLNENWRITVIEKDSYISSATCGLPYALGRVIESEASLHVQTTDKMKSWFNIDIMVNTEAVRIDREKKEVTVRRSVEGKKGCNGVIGTGAAEIPTVLHYDKLVIATGAEAVYPRIEGVDAEHVFPLRTIADLNRIQQYRWTHSIQDVAIIGGGFIGLEAAENLVKLGLDVTLFEFLPQVMPAVDAFIAEYLHTELRRHGVQVVLNARIAKIDRPRPPDQAFIHLENSSETYPADAIIMAAGIRGRTELAEKAGLSVSRSGITVTNTMQTSDPDIYAVGDVVATPNLITSSMHNLALGGPANRQGRLAADHISGRHVHYTGHIGTFVCKVFDLTVASVGLTVSQLTKLHREDFDYVTIHPPDHASYYPGASPITLVVAFSRPTGTIIGAQAVGKKGVEKRIDILATAIHAGMTITDLQDLELCYAPPYSSAKDPINMAGYVGSNVLLDDVKIMHAASLLHPHDLSQYTIIDVRSRKEFAGSQGHIRHAVNIPLAELRQRIDEIDVEVDDNGNEVKSLDKGRKVLVYCQVGYRGYLAYRILKQRGFENVFNLDGGFKIVAEGGFKGLVEGKGK